MLRKIPEFKNNVPEKRRVLNGINEFVEISIKLNVDKIISAELPFSIAVDIPTTKGMKNSYYGVIISYMNEELENMDFALDVIELKERHTGENLKKALTDSLAKWGLKIEDASAIVTDGASNMAKAFR